MPIHILKLKGREEVARGTITLHFEKPINFNFKPGQYGGFTLINPTETDAGGITRRFSLLSTPDENTVAIATRIQNSAFKRVLNSLPIGGEIKFAGPTGTFTLHEDTTIPAVMIAGGIGIAPFYCMIKHACAQKSPQQIYLFYGNQSEQDSAFLTELSKLEKENENFKLIPTMANPSQAWQGETGFVTHTMIKKYIPDIYSPYYYICGSPVMVTAIQELIAEMGVNEDKLKVEDFPGY